MPVQSPMDRFIGRFLQGLQVYQSFQDMENRQKQTGIQQQRLDIERQKMDEEQRAADYFRQAGQGYIESLPKTQTVDIPGTQPTFTGEGPLGPRLSPELAMPPSTIERPRGLSDEERGMAAALTKGDVGTFERFVAGARKMAPPQVINDPAVGPFVVGPGGQPHFPPQRERPLSPADTRHFTAESLQAYYATGNPSVLQPRIENIGPQSFERDLENRANALGLTGKAKLDWKETERVKHAKEVAPPIVVPLGPTTTVLPRGQIPSTGTNLTEGLNPDQQRRANQAVADLGGTMAIINQMEKLTKNVNTAAPGVGRFTKGVKNVFGALLQTDDEAAQLQTLQTSYANIINRSVLAEKGVLTNQDRTYAANSIPSLWDSDKRAASKIGTLKGLEQIRLDAEQAIAEGKFNASEFRKRLDNLWSSGGEAIKQAPANDPVADWIKKNTGR